MCEEGKNDRTERTKGQTKIIVGESNIILLA